MGLERNNHSEMLFSTRPVTVIELPLSPGTEILHPEHVLIKIAIGTYDLGALCYALRSPAVRKRSKPSGVVLSSFIPNRRKQILLAIKLFSGMITDLGKRPRSVLGAIGYFKKFVDWADAAERYDCLDGGNATRSAYRAYVANIEERYRQHEFSDSRYGWRLQSDICETLQVITGVDDLSRGVRLIKVKPSPNGGTEPAGERDFAHILGLNQAIFDGISDLVLEDKPFPFKLDIPKSIGWKDSFLWIFPVNQWRLPPHEWGKVRSERRNPYFAYDYENGRLASVDEVWYLYARSTRSLQRSNANEGIKRAQGHLNAANSDSRYHIRIKLAKIAHNAFIFLFLANTGCNLAVAENIETDGIVDASTLNQSYRTIKFRAEGKDVQIVVPVAFMPTLRRFMALRKYLLNGGDYPYLFFTQGTGKGKAITQITPSTIESSYCVLCGIDPKVPRIGPKKIRATVEDFYRRKTDASIAARVLGHSEDVADSNYLAGSPFDHQDEMTLFLCKVSETARKQKIVANGTDLGDARSLEEGGRCSSFGEPEPLSQEVSIKPDCHQGCLFCAKRILVANEEDVRKVASAAFVMEQLILGPISEGAFRPQIQKCDDDLEKIASFDNCRAMVRRIREAVYEEGDLTPYFADKYQLFLELGVL